MSARTPRTTATSMTMIPATTPTEEERGQDGDDRDSQLERQPNADEIGGRVGAGS
jgi:hypothetical protein